MLYFVIKANKRYYPQTFRYYLQTLLEECKNEIKNNEMENLINDTLEQSSFDESDNDESND